MGRHRQITDERIDRAIELVRAGIGVKAAAKAAGMSHMTLYRFLRRRGLMAEIPRRAPKPRRRPQPGLAEARRARRDAAFAMRERGLTFGEIGSELGVTVQAAHQLWLTALKARGLEPPGRPSEADRDAARERRRKVLALREQRLTFAAIGAELGMTEVRARSLYRAALLECGMSPPPRPVATPRTERRVETRDQLVLVQRAVRAGDLCGWCGRHLDDGETVYVDTLQVAVERAPDAGPSRDPVWIRAPMGIECASPKLLAEVAGQQPEPCVVCGRGVIHRRSDARRKRITCSRRCGYASAKQRQKAAGSRPHT